MPDWLNILVRSAVLFLITLFIVRLLGRRQTAPLTYFNVMVAIVIGALVTAISLNLVNLITGFAALAVWSAFPIALSFLAIKYKAVRDIVQGKEIVLINHGKILEDKLMEARFTPEDLLSRLRRKNVFNFSDVEFAVLEPTGEVSVMLKKDKQFITPKALGLKVGQESVPQTVMMDGIIMDEPLAAMGLNREWLYAELEKVGVAPENVFLAQVDSAGQLYLDLFDDAVKVPQPKAKELVYATLKKCQADCELFALGTKNSEAKNIYISSSKILSNVIKELEQYLVR